MTDEEKQMAYTKRDKELAQKFGTDLSVIRAIKGMSGLGYKPQEIVSHFGRKISNLIKHKNHNPDRLAHANQVVAFLGRITKEDLEEINKPVTNKPF